MIYGLSKDIAGILLARKFPVNVLYGPEHTIREEYSSALVFERDRDASDSVDSAKGQRPNPNKRLTRYLAAKATLYVKSRLPGARVGEHEWECEQLIDAVLVAFDDWDTQAKSIIRVTDGRYSYAGQSPVTDKWSAAGGVAYVLKFTVGRGVSTLDYSGNGYPTGSAAHTANVTKASIDGGVHHTDVATHSA